MPEPAAVSKSDHSALMDVVYNHQRHIYDATRKFFLLGRDRLIAELKPEPGQSVLEVGCGTGRNLIVAARRYPQATFYGFDISEKMLETARRNIAKAGLSDRIKLAIADASAFSSTEMFGRKMDRVVLSYTLSMIPPWREAIAQSLEALNDAGALYVVDFGQLERLPRWAKAILSGWLNLFHGSPRADLRQALESAAQAAGRRADFQPLYRGYAWFGRIE